eukprot:11215788-Lingulodinium_polyedra.AAC.1
MPMLRTPGWLGAQRQSRPDLNTLRFVGFLTDFDLVQGSRRSAATKRLLEDNDQLASQAFDLVVALLRQRAAAMSWHASTWPGLLALCGSADPVDQDAGLARLRADFAAFTAAKALAPTSTFLGKVCAKSAFATRLVSEAAALACSSPGTSDEEAKGGLYQLSCLVFQGWGQTKVVEDGFQRARDVEERTTRNKLLASKRQWATMKDGK